MAIASLRDLSDVPQGQSPLARQFTGGDVPPDWTNSPVGTTDAPRSPRSRCRRHSPRRALPPPRPSARKSASTRPTSQPAAASSADTGHATE